MNNIFENAEEKIKMNWEVHRQAFGPILEPAFQENQEVRLKLCAALNYISRRDVKKGYDILMEIKKFCIYNEDKAAWNYFMGLCFEFMGSKTEMVKWYEKANAYSHVFYLPYLKLAKCYHNDARFLNAEQNYNLAIDCLENAEEDYKDDRVLGSAYANLTSCLTMMHRYKAAENTYRKAVRYPVGKGTAAIGAILYAAMGNKEETERFLKLTEKEIPPLYPHTKHMTEDILSHKHPHFCPVELDKCLYSEFWTWFSQNKESIKAQETETVKVFTEKLKQIFTFLEREIRFRITREQGKYKIYFSDFFAMALNFGYKELIDSCPEDISREFDFGIER